MRTLLHVFATFSAGGPQVRFANVANHLGRAYRHIIVAMDDVTTALQLLDAELDVELLSLPMRSRHGFLDIINFRKMLAHVRPDLLVTSNWGSIEWVMANHLFGVPHVHLEDGFGPEESDCQLWRRIQARRILLRHSIVVVPSRRLYAIAQDVWRLPKARTFYVPNGIDCNRFVSIPDPSFAAATGIAGGVPVIGTVTRLSPEKNLYRLIDAFAEVLRCRPAMLAIVGDGPEQMALRAYARERRVDQQIVFAGICLSPERLLPSFDVFAVSSDTEQMPLSVLEAMAAGRPIAATDVGDLRHMVSEENRPFIVAREASRLGAAILNLLDQPCQTAAIGAANARRAREVFDQNVCITQYGRLFGGKLPCRQF